ncbi:MAG: hypothetical protein P1V20_25810, partial [Verrucomicrobiales bacterium]|nr:hypothetical protein [Verrucomicrobiales bacterium]
MSRRFSKRREVLKTSTCITVFITAIFAVPNRVSAQEVEPAVETEAEAVAEELPETAVTATQTPPEPTPPPPAPPAPATPPPAPVPEPEPAPVEPLIITDPLLPDEVTAFRTGTPLIDIPQSLTVFSEERIEDQGITSL